MSDKLIQDTYLGDGVYASFDGYHVWLDLRVQNPANRIALEPEVLDALWQYRRAIQAAIESAQEGTSTTENP